MERTFYYCFRKEAIAPALFAFVIITVGLLSLYLYQEISQSSLTTIKYFIYALSIFFLSVSIWFYLRPDEKYIVLTDTTVEIISEKSSLEIPRSEISTVELCVSPIEHKILSRYGAVYVGEARNLLKLSVKDTFVNVISTYSSVLDKQLFQSQFIYISKDNKQIYLQKPPVGGFQELLESLQK